MDNFFTLSTGHKIFLKTFFSRGLKKRINQSILSGCEVDEKRNLKGGVKGDVFETVNDILLVGMTEKILDQEGKELPVTVETYDNFIAEDVEVIIKAINEITKEKELPKA